MWAQPGNINISITDKTTMASFQTTVPKSRWVGLAGPLLQTRLSKHIDTPQHTPPKHTLSLCHLRCRLRVPHVSCTQPPPPSNSILQGDIPAGAPIAAAPHLLNCLRGESCNPWWHSKHQISHHALTRSQQVLASCCHEQKTARRSEEHLTVTLYAG